MKSFHLEIYDRNGRSIRSIDVFATDVDGAISQGKLIQSWLRPSERGGEFILRDATATVRRLAADGSCS